MPKPGSIVVLLALAGVPLAYPHAGPERTPSPAQERDWHEALDSREPIGFFIAADDEPDSAARSGDAQLARWALRAWEEAAEGRFELVAAARDRSLIHLYWVSGADGLYGEMRPFLLGEQRGAAVFVLPDTSGLGGEIHRRAGHDPLFRETVVYLTCLHELGHALGLPHTQAYADIMYSFRYGGDIVGYFQRYRDRIDTREDIARVPGLSEEDIASLRALYDRSP